MARSAKSKGYRKYNNTKKTGHAWTDKEKKICLYGGGAICLVLIIALLWMPVYNLFTGVRVEDGVQVGVEDNWVTYNLGTQSKPKVVKLARLDSIPEGYAQTVAERSLYMMDRLEYAPTDEGAFPAEVMLRGSGENYEQLSSEAYDRLAMIGEVFYKSEIVKAKFGGNKTAYFVQNYSTVTTDDAGTETTNYYQYLYGYVNGRRHNTCVLVAVGGNVESEADFVSDDVLVTEFESFVKNLSMK